MSSGYQTTSVRESDGLMWHRIDLDVPDDSHRAQLNDLARKATGGVGWYSKRLGPKRYRFGFQQEASLLYFIIFH